MMYKCKECGTEYKEKPDYCDCGNDEFELIEEKKVITEHPQKPKQEDIKTEVQLSKPQPASIIHSQTAPHKAIYKPSVDAASLTIFCLCLLLSLYVVFFAWNIKEGNNVQQETNQTSVNTGNIPSVDKIWNNALPAVKKEEPKVEEKVENIIKQLIPVQTQKKTEIQKPATSNVNSQKQKVTTVPLKKTTQTAQSSKTTATVKQQTNINVQEQAKKAEEAAKKKAEQERKAAEEAQIKKLQAEQAKKLAEQKAKQAEADKQEFINYKANLRNTIGRKIDFTRVIGDGSCTISFKIDANGKLVNRSFSKQSSNNTLNDAVYAAVMATPTFNPPPNAYNRETLNLNISFYNGNFEISLP